MFWLHFIMFWLHLNQKSNTGVNFDQHGGEFRPMWGSFDQCWGNWRPLKLIVIYPKISQKVPHVRQPGKSCLIAQGPPNAPKWSPITPSLFLTYPISQNLYVGQNTAYFLKHNSYFFGLFCKVFENFLVTFSLLKLGKKIISDKMIKNKFSTKSYPQILFRFNVVVQASRSVFTPKMARSPIAPNDYTPHYIASFYMICITLSLAY